jgi:hypothetical protein
VIHLFLHEDARPNTAVEGAVLDQFAAGALQKHVLGSECYSFSAIPCFQGSRQSDRRTDHNVRLCSAREFLINIEKKLLPFLHGRDIQLPIADNQAFHAQIVA